jgi:UDP-N-acetylmuramyl pentapeptide phosphotransferase/UDP-N-acetylglucosamine-1-phosphate transferase
MPIEMLFTAAAAAVISAALVQAMMPLLRRYALARPNARSSHDLPTPQGAGLAVLLATILVAAAALGLASAEEIAMREAALVLAASLILAATGAIDDLRPLGPLAKLVPQIIAVGIVVFLAIPEEVRLVSALPPWLERGLATLAGVWFVNLVNFMDGIDWITVMGCGVPLAALAILAAVQPAEGEAAGVVAASLAGALIGFAPFNKPVARVFLGDVGSLPIGLVLGYGLYRLALAGHLAAALILPLYYVWDSGSTLMRRLAKGEPVWQAHRSHIYQRATDAGWSVMAVVAQILVLEIALALLAFVSAWQDSMLLSAIALVVAAGLVGIASKRLLAGPPAAREAPH